MALNPYEFLILVGMAGVRLMVPILFAALGEILIERSGVMNLSIEGMMMLGAFITYFGTDYFQSIPLGLMIALVVGAAVGLCLAIFYVPLRANQAAVGLSFWFLLTGITLYLYRVTYGVLLVPKRIVSLEQVNIPVLHQIPVIGPIFFSQNLLVYVSFLFTIVLGIILTKTTLGLKITATGINPKAAQAQGINVHRLRILCTVVGTMLIALGGGYLATELRVFSDFMIAGRGWIAIGVAIFSGWSPYKAIGGAFLFGVVDSLQLQLQVLFPGWPYQILMMMPFIVTIGTLALISRKVVYPSALGTPF
jgi:simple sugar transport system permease protein